MIYLEQLDHGQMVWSNSILFLQTRGTWVREDLQHGGLLLIKTNQTKLRTDLCEDGLSSRCRIGGVSDWATYDDVAGASGDGLRGSYNADLIGVAGSSGTNAGRDQGEFVAEMFAKFGSFASGGDNAVTSASQGKSCEA
jgi:hypothetical protein